VVVSCIGILTHGGGGKNCEIMQNFSQRVVERSAAQQVMAPTVTANGGIGLSWQPQGQQLVP
jgi:hypothetical protein